MDKKERSNEILKILNNKIPNSKCELNFKNNFELLIAVILSAQCTDKQVNIVTENLFKLYDTPEKISRASVYELENIIKSCGFYKNKAIHIHECCLQLVNKFGSVVPNDFIDLLTLSGVGRKTANVVLAVGFNIPAIPVDTHVFRISKRLGLYDGDNVEECETELMILFPKSEWINLHYMLISFGRYYCKALKPECENCELKGYCVKNGHNDMRR